MRPACGILTTTPVVPRRPRQARQHHQYARRTRSCHEVSSSAHARLGAQSHTYPVRRRIPTGSILFLKKVRPATPDQRCIGQQCRTVPRLNRIHHVAPRLIAADVTQGVVRERKSPARWFDRPARAGGGGPPQRTRGACARRSSRDCRIARTGLLRAGHQGTQLAPPVRWRERWAADGPRSPYNGDVMTFLHRSDWPPHAPRPGAPGCLPGQRRVRLRSACQPVDVAPAYSARAVRRPPRPATG